MHTNVSSTMASSQYIRHSVELPRKETIHANFVCDPLCVVICQSSRHYFLRLKDRSPRDLVLPCDINMRADCM